MMPLKYANCIQSIVRKHMHTKPINVEKLVLNMLNINPNQIPDDFPKIIQLKRKFSSVKQNMRKKEVTNVNVTSLEKRHYIVPLIPIL